MNKETDEIMIGRAVMNWARRLIKNRKSGRHEWIDCGVDSGGLGQAFGDRRLRCQKCGKIFIYAAIDHDHFERADREQCPGPKEAK